MIFKDYFSGHASDDVDYRPHYPANLFTWLAQQCADRVWDCAAGNGHAAIALADYFRIVATDGSAVQLQQAPTIRASPIKWRSRRAAVLSSLA